MADAAKLKYCSGRHSSNYGECFCSTLSSQGRLRGWVWCGLQIHVTGNQRIHYFFEIRSIYCWVEKNKPLELFMKCWRYNWNNILYAQIEATLWSGDNNVSDMPFYRASLSDMPFYRASLSDMPFCPWPRWILWQMWVYARSLQLVGCLVYGSKNKLMPSTVALANATLPLKANNRRYGDMLSQH